MQAAHPTSLIMAYLDDNYTFDEPLEAYACMLTGSRVTEEEAGVASNMDKQEVYSPEADLADLPATLRGAAGRRPVRRQTRARATEAGGFRASESSGRTLATKRLARRR